MKIAIVATHYYPIISGVSTVVELTADYLKKQGNEVSVFSKRIKSLSQKEERNGLKIYRYGYLTKYLFSLELLSFLRKGNFDLIHSHEYAYFHPLASLVVSKFKKIPHFHTPHFHFVGNKLNRFFAELQGRLIFNNSYLIALTEQENKILRSFGAKKVKTIPNPIDTSFFTPGNIKKEDLILYVGRFADWKLGNFPEVAERIIKKEGNVKIAFIGFATNEKIDVLKKRFPDRVIVRKDVPQEELLNWYQRAKILVLPSKYEAFGMVAAEALSVETPVIASRVGGTEEVIQDNKTGLLFDYKNPDELEKKIISLLNNEQLRKEMGKRGRRFVVENFDINIVGQKISEYYKKIISQPL